MICPDCDSGRRGDGFNRNGWFWLECNRRYNPSIDAYSPENAHCRNIQLEAINADLLEACKEFVRVHACGGFVEPAYDVIEQAKQAICKAEEYIK